MIPGPSYMVVLEVGNLILSFNFTILQAKINQAVIKKCQHIWGWPIIGRKKRCKVLWSQLYSLILFTSIFNDMLVGHEEESLGHELRWCRRLQVFVFAIISRLSGRADEDTYRKTRVLPVLSWFSFYILYGQDGQMCMT